MQSGHVWPDCCLPVSRQAKTSKSKETIPVTVLQPTTIDLPRSYVADIQAIQFVEIKARVEGFIREVLVDEGQLVKKDSLCSA